MADDLDTFISALQDNWAAVTGVASAPDHPPEEPSVLQVVSYLTGGRPANVKAGTWIHIGRSDVYIARSDLYHDEAAARPFILLGLAMFVGNVTQDGSCEYCMPTGYSIGALEGQGWFVVRFEWEAKIAHSTLSIAA